MIGKIKRYLYLLIFTSLVVFGSIISFKQEVFGKTPKFDSYVDSLDGFVIEKGGVDEDKTLKENIVELFYPSTNGEGNRIFKVIRTMTLGLMIIFIFWAGATLLLKRDSNDVSKSMSSLLYIVLGGVFIFGANWLFGSVLDFNQGKLTDAGSAIGGVKEALVGADSVLFRVLSAVKVVAFFLAIIMIVVTGFKVISAGEGEKGKTLIKGLINVVVALVVIKGVDFIYYMAADGNFVDRAATFIINVAKLFAYLYGTVIVIMVFVAGYLYITDGGDGDGFKKASNLLVNILLSALVLFSFLLILYQVFAEFRTGGDAVEEHPEGVSYVLNSNDSLV